MIRIKNTQRTTTVNSNQLKKDAQKILDYLGYSDFDLGIWLTTNQTIQHYNATYRKKNNPTDILSFPYHTDLIAGQLIRPKTTDDKNLGDIIMSPEYIQQAATTLKISFNKRMRILLIHGICHLLGYDHIKDKDYAIMQKKEDDLMEFLETE